MSERQIAEQQQDFPIAYEQAHPVW